MRLFLKFAILLLCTKSFSQDVVITYSRKIDLPKANFFITDIVDARSEHTYKNVGKTLFTAAFKGSVFLMYQVEWTSQRCKYAINMGNGEFFPLD